MKKKHQVINIAEAKARLPELVERASNGEEIVLARNGKAKAKLVPITGKKAYVYAAGKGKWKGIERVLATPLPDDLLITFSTGMSTSVKGSR